MRTPYLLLVEDDDDTRESLIALYRRVWPDVRIDAGASVEEGLALIRAAALAHESYDVAILDLKLPPAPGLNDTIDVRLCEAVLTSSPGTPIAHVTAWIADPQVSAHIEAVHPARRPRGFLVSKLTAGYAQELLTKTCECVYGAQIEAACDALFGDGSSGPRPGSLAARIGDLCQDVAAGWAYLDDPLRQKLRARLNVDDSDPETVRVGLR